MPAAAKQKATKSRISRAVDILLQQFKELDEAAKQRKIKAEAMENLKKMVNDAIAELKKAKKVGGLVTQMDKIEKQITEKVPKRLRGEWENIQNEHTGQLAKRMRKLLGKALQQRAIAESARARVPEPASAAATTAEEPKKRLRVRVIERGLPDTAEIIERIQQRLASDKPIPALRDPVDEEEAEITKEVVKEAMQNKYPKFENEKKRKWFEREVKREVQALLDKERNKKKTEPKKPKTNGEPGEGGGAREQPIEERKHEKVKQHKEALKKVEREIVKGR